MAEVSRYFEMNNDGNSSSHWLPANAASMNAMNFNEVTDKSFIGVSGTS